MSTNANIVALTQLESNPTINNYTGPSTANDLQFDSFPSTSMPDVTTEDNYNLPGSLRDNVNSYTQVWNP